MTRKRAERGQEMVEEGNKRLRENIVKKLIVLIFPLFLFAQNNYVFGPSVMVNDDAPGTHLHGTTQRSIACRGDTVYLVWEDNRYGSPIYYNHRVFFSKSTDAGNTWSPNAIISQDTDNYPCFDAHLSLDAFGSIYVAYCGQDGSTNNNDIYFTKSSDGGDSFSLPLLVNDCTEVHHQGYSSCAVDSSGQNVYIVWEDGRDPQHSIDIYLARSTDGGISFLPSMRVNDDDSAYQWFPVVACDNSGQNVYVAWQDNRDTLHGWDVYFSRSTDGGSTFLPNYPVNDTGVSGNSSQRKPSICWRNGVINLAWDDLRPGGGIFFDKSSDGGMNFGVDVFVVDTPDVSAYPSIAVNDSGKICVVWVDGREFSTYGSDIYFAFSSDSGQSFSENILVNDHLGSVGAWDENPAICVNSEGKVFVAWDSDRDDPSHTFEDIYFARGTYVGIEEHAGGYTPDAVRLDVYPNPFAKLITISFGVGRTDRITHSSYGTGSATSVGLRIYDISGRLVRQFDYKTMGLSDHIIWMGNDEQGHQVPTGIYFLELVSGKDRYVRKVVKIE